MPFPKLRLKKSKQQYNVASKAMYVITVELLDNNQLECTLTAESTGRDCMDNVCRRVNLQQPDLFGLKFYSRRPYPKYRWVDLDRPLKKQLDKYAQQPTGPLHLGVMFYVHDVSLLEDEVTRFHYFMQLKYDVLDGKLRCNYEQAIVLASYLLQAESGDHDTDRHTLDNLQELPLLPKIMMTQLSEERYAALTDAIIAQHASLRGIARQLAEVYYIVGAQQLDGYGQECFLARDERGTEVLIGASLTGIVIREGPSPHFYKWNDITNLVNHKRYFGIECQNYEHSIQFILDEPESAKYVWKMCVLQHTFYKLHASATETMSELNITLEHQPNNNRFESEEQQATVTTGNRHPINFNHPGVGKLRPAISSGSVHKAVGSNFVAAQDDMVLLNNATRSTLFSQTMSGARSVNDLDQLPSNSAMGPQSTLPAYRAAPDYETAMRNKFRSQPKFITDLVQASGQATLATTLENPEPSSQNLTQHNHPASSMYSTSTPELNRINLTYHHHPQQQHHLAPHHSNNVLSQSYNMPTQDQILAELQRLNVYKPPPPYPGTNANGQHQHIHGETRMISSTSTPDLATSVNISSTFNATHTGALLGGSSPDLVSRKNLGNKAKDQPLHQATDNLNHLIEQPMQYEDPEMDHHQVGGFSQQVMASAAASLHTHKYSNVSNPSSEPSQEPIYQNQAELGLLKEPIYQNLPAHDKLIMQGPSTCPPTDCTPLGTDLSDKLLKTGHVSRVAITNSREDLSSQHTEYIQPHEEAMSEVDTAAVLRKKSVTKINIGQVAGIDDNFVEQVTAKSPPKKPARLKASGSQSVENLMTISDDSHLSLNSPMMMSATPNSSKTTIVSSNTPRTPSSKPRAGRKRWAFNFGGSKTGSLKSLKSLKSTGNPELGADDDNHKKESTLNKFGPMMLATLHGLTRSRPDLLTESLATFSTFASPSRMPKDEIGAHLEAKLAEGEVLREFERIPKKKLPTGTGYEQLFRTATLAENVPLNRFKDVLPYDENRVKLAAGDKDNRNGYINASHVSATVGEQQRFYIAGQGPLPHTVAHFWQMVQQCDVHLLVMLTEASAESSIIPYWPTKEGATVEVGNGFKITHLSSATYEDAYTTTTLQLTHLPSGKSRTLWHLQYTDWGEAGCPTNVRAFLNFLEELSALRNHISTNAAQIIGIGRNKNPPVLVHCSAGVGRTGVAILTDILLYCVDHNVDIDIPKMLTHLRQQRMLMVQTVAQYKFVHTALIAYLKQSRLI